MGGGALYRSISLNRDWQMPFHLKMFNHESNYILVGVNFKKYKGQGIGQTHSVCPKGACNFGIIINEYCTVPYIQVNYLEKMLEFSVLLKVCLHHKWAYNCILYEYLCNMYRCQQPKLKFINYLILIGTTQQSC